MNEPWCVKIMKNVYYREHNKRLMIAPIKFFLKLEALKNKTNFLSRVEFLSLEKHQQMSNSQVTKMSQSN